MGERGRGSECSGRHDLIVVENEFHLLSHSKFIAFVQQESRGKDTVYHHLAHDLNERRNESKSTSVKFGCNDTN